MYLKEREASLKTNLSNFEEITEIRTTQLEELEEEFNFKNNLSPGYF